MSVKCLCTKWHVLWCGEHESALQNCKIDVICAMDGCELTATNGFRMTDKLHFTAMSILAPAVNQNPGCCTLAMS